MQATIILDGGSIYYVELNDKGHPEEEFVNDLPERLKQD